jgi:hypothetical protein
MNEDPRWWHHPQGIVAAITIATAILGFFYVREKQLWEQSILIKALQARGEAAITRMDAKHDKLEMGIYELRDRVRTLEYKLGVRDNE